MLEAVKISLGITGTYQDNTIQKWIDEIKQLMVDGGIPLSVVNDEKSAGIIAKGIDDLYFQKNNCTFSIKIKLNIKIDALK